MEKQTKIRNLPFLSARATAIRRYGLNMTEDDFIEEAYAVWRTMGNTAPSIKRMFVSVPEDFVIELPEEAEFIESVIIVNEPTERRYFSSAGDSDRYSPAHRTVESSPELNQSLSSAISGKSVNYILIGDNAIQITSPDAYGRDLMIVYLSILKDEMGLPMLNDKETDAIAAEVTRRDTVLKAFKGIASAVKLLGYIVGEADRLMAAAKVDEYINSDALDQALDIKSSYDRKVYGQRFNLMN